MAQTPDEELKSRGIAAIATYSSNQPILTDTPIASAAKGSEALAQSFGEVAKSASEISADLEQDKSSAMYTQAVSNMQQVKNDAHIQMIQNPGHAQTIADNAKNSIQTINTSAYVNRGDRQRLGINSIDANDELELKAAQVTQEQNKLQGAYSFYASLPTTMQAYQDALIKNPDQAESIKNGMISTMHGLVMTGALTPHEAGSTIQTMGDLVGAAQDAHNVYGNSAATAQDYHTTTSSPLNQSTQNAGAPINQNTQWLIDYHMQDTSLRGVLSDITNRTLPDPQTFMNLSDTDRQHAMLAINGTKVADGMINSGAPYPQISNAYNEMTQKGLKLGYQAEATKNALGMYVNNLKNGNFLQAISTTPAGGAIMQNYNNRQAAIQNDPTLDDGQKAQMSYWNKNNLVNKAASYGVATHTPSNLIQPIPKSDVAMMQSAFDTNGKPENLLGVLNDYSKDNKMWAANALKTPEQHLITQSIAMAGDELPPQNSIDMIAANRKGMDYSKITDDKDVSDVALKGQIATALSDQTKFLITQYGVSDGIKLQNAMIDTSTKFVKYQAAKNNDLTLSNATSYIHQAAAFYKESYPIQSGSNYAFNPRQVNLTSQQADALASYAIGEGHKHIQGDVSESQYRVAVYRGSNPLSMTISPTGHVIAQDSNGNIYFDKPFSPKLVSAAITQQRKAVNKLPTQTGLVQQDTTSANNLPASFEIMNRGG